ncbi:MAG: hypothetical protein DCF19_02980 [Pseudanabaena frigida]|uniref:Radical SAM core domain-containing protein n=1 Tax=Pseudanabaena frigida TaxID=945775 RepID=A0A2W4WI29_9CYAN|nr:MAG: hypothetical protein DCF19_02980 [Pseudanabaena frigida]
MIIDYTLSLAEYLAKQNLQHLILHVTNNCNFRCDHCFIDFSPKRDLTLAQYQDLAKQVGKIFWLDIAGGEPFLRLDLAEIISAFDFKVVQIPSNGSLCDRTIAQLQKLKQLTKAEITISLSIDGLEATHDRLRHQQGSWQQVWKTLAAIKELGGISVKINTVLNVENAHEIIDVMKVVRQYEPDFHSIILLRGDPINPSLGLPSVDKLKKLAPDMFAILETYSYGRNKFAARILRNYHRYLWKISLQTIEQKTQVIPCLAGTAHQVVWGDGRVSPCEMLEPVGTLQTQTLKEITSSPDWQQQLKDIQEKKCHCTHNCAMFDSIFFNPTNFPHLAMG